MNIRRIFDQEEEPEAHGDPKSYENERGVQKKPHREMKVCA